MPLPNRDLPRLTEYIAKHGSADGFVPTPQKKRSNEEFKLQAAVIAWWSVYCKQVGVPEFLLWHTPNSAVYGGSQSQREKMGAMLKRLGQRSGVPDLFLAVGRSAKRQGLSALLWDRGLFLELKAAKGVLSDEQKIMIPELERQGYRVAVCRTIEECKKVITEYLAK